MGRREGPVVVVTRSQQALLKRLDYGKAVFDAVFIDYEPRGDQDDLDLMALSVAEMVDVLSGPTGELYVRLTDKARGFLAEDCNRSQSRIRRPA